MLVFRGVNVILAVTSCDFNTALNRILQLAFLAMPSDLPPHQPSGCWQWHVRWGPTYDRLACETYLERKRQVSQEPAFVLSKSISSWGIYGGKGNWKIFEKVDMISISFKVRTAQMVASDGIMSRGTMGAFWSLSFSRCLFFEFFPSKAFGETRWILCRSKQASSSLSSATGGRHWCRGEWCSSHTLGKTTAICFYPNKKCRQKIRTNF